MSLSRSKQLLAAVLAAAMAASLAACGSGTGTPTSSTPAAPDGASSAPDASGAPEASGAKEIYFLNFKPEIAPVYEEIAKEYEAETGVKVIINTAASGTYEQTLKSEVAKKDAPTIFQINGPVGYQSWKDYCLDLKDTELYGHLTDKTLAVTSGEGVYGIPYVVEGYGIIYNNAIMEKYFALPDKAVALGSAAEIKDFAALKSVVEDMTAKKDALGIKGVFSSTSMSPGNQWRWQTHLANLPFYYEFKESAGTGSPLLTGLDAAEVTFKYADNFKNLFDLYINNSTVEKGLLGAKAVSDSMAEFALGQSAMVQNGNWAWADISGVEGNVVEADNIRYLPVYTGMPDDAKQGLCVGTENYLAINSKVDAGKQQASIDFLNWLFTSDKGKAYVTSSDKLGFIAPFDTFTDAEKPSDPLAREVLAWMEKTDVSSIPWTFAAFPSEEFKNYFGDALLEYAQGGKTWDEVKTIAIDSWKSERAKAQPTA